MFGFAKTKKSRKQRSEHSLANFAGILKVSAVACVLIAAGVGLVFLDTYVEKVVPVSQKIGVLELIDVPVWANDLLKKKIYSAAMADGGDLRLDEDAAKSVQKNIAEQVVWLDEVKVQVTHDSISIKANWRKPLALITPSLRKRCYVDAEMVVLDFVPMPGLPIVEVKGLARYKTPSPGDVLEREDLAAAIALLDRLDQMDGLVTPDKPLLSEIDRIDMSNFNGRRSSVKPHIVLYAKDGTEIIWGAQIGAWQRYLEATDEEKLGGLYEYYKEYGTLLNGVKYINLRNPQGNISQPVDKY